jgi:hypothetical protein
MRLRTMTLLSLAALGVTLAWLSSTAVATENAADATGTWKWSVTFNDNTIEQTLKLKQDGEKLTGSLIGRNGNETEIKEGKIKDGALSFSITREFNGNSFTQKYSGKLEGDAIKGKIEFERNGEAQSRDWEAKRGS